MINIKKYRHKKTDVETGAQKQKLFTGNSTGNAQTPNVSINVNDREHLTINELTKALQLHKKKGIQDFLLSNEGNSI